MKEIEELKSLCERHANWESVKDWEWYSNSKSLITALESARVGEVEWSRGTVGHIARLDANYGRKLISFQGQVGELFFIPTPKENE